MHSFRSFNGISPSSSRRLFLSNIKRMLLPVALMLALVTGAGFSALPAQTAGDYRSIIAGTVNWSDASTWERFDGSSWVAAAAAPDFNDGVITVRTPTYILINSNLTLDQTIIENGATVQLSSAGSTLTINNGVGTDLQLNGISSTVWANEHLLNVTSGALIEGTSSALAYRGSTLINNGTINATLNPRPDVASTTISGVGSINTIVTSNNGGLFLSGDQTITSLLNFNFGNVITGASKLILATTASVQNNSATDYYVIGNLQTNFPAGTGTRTYRVGDNLGYRPVDVTVFNSLGNGGVTISTSNPDHPNIATSDIDPTLSVNRYWSVEVAVGNTDVWTTFNWQAADVDAGANTGNFVVREYNGNWSIATIINQSATSARVRTVSSGRNEFAIGESTADPTATAGDYRNVTNGNWNNPAIWQTYTGTAWIAATVAPNNSNANVIKVVSFSNITITSTALTADQLVVENGATINVSEAAFTIADGTGIDLVNNGIINLTSADLIIATGAEASFATGSRLSLDGQDNIQGAGTINFLSGSNFSVDGFYGGNKFRGDITINNYGTFNFTGSNDLDFEGTAQFINQAGASFNWSAISNINFLGNDNQFLNSGDLTITGGGDFSGTGAVNPSVSNLSGGTFTINNAPGDVTGIASDIAFTNNGSTIITSGTLNLNNSNPNHAGSFTISSGAELTGTANINFTGTSFTNNGSVTTAELAFTGSSAQTLAGNGIIQTLRINNANGLSLTGNQNVFFFLHLTNGKISTGANKLILDDGVTITGGSTSSYVIGNLERKVTSPGAKAFPIGTITSYAPVTLDPSFTGTGALQARTDDGDHPDIANSGIDQNKSVNRRWTLTNNGLAFTECDVTFNWSAVDVDGGVNFSNFKLAKLDGTTWTLPTVLSTTATSLSVLDLTSFSEFQIGEVAECVVNIPDANFKTYLLAQAAINTNGDGEIQCAEATAYTGAISMDNLGVSNLTGIEAFTGLKTLEVLNDQLTTVNLSANTALEKLKIYNNQLTAIDLSANTALTDLDLGSNQLTAFDVSPLVNLAFFDCRANQLTSIDVTQNTALLSLVISGNSGITSLDVTANTALISLEANAVSIPFINTSTLSNLQMFSAGFGLLNSIDVTNNTQLKQLNVSSSLLTSINLTSNPLIEQLTVAGNQLTSLDVSNLTALKFLYCGSNQLTTLDVSNLPALIELSCNGNQLVSLNLKNGNNAAITTLDARNNALLTCIQVDDVTNANGYAGWTKDASASYSTNCSLSLPAAALNFDGVDDQVTINNAGLDVSNKSFSVEMWLKRNSSNTYDVAFSQGVAGADNQLLHMGFSSNDEFIFNFFGGPNDLENSYYK